LLMFLDYNRLINKRKVKKYINKAKGKVEWKKIVSVLYLN
jgi:hypothetical protein